MIIEKKKVNRIMRYTVDKDITDEAMSKKLNTKVKRADITLILDHDADVFTKEGKLLLRFRKNALSPTHLQTFYDNVIQFAKTPTTNRGSAMGSTKKNIYENAEIMTNILGFFDNISPRQKFMLKNHGKTLKLKARETRFNADYPEKYKKILPLIRQIDACYKKQIPDQYKLQRAKADQTYFKIEGTSFTTVTTNVNFQTTIHTDKGDDEEGFGNLTVIEHGKYTGGETCIPQYGIGADVRTGDILFMDVHQPHGNLPFQLKSPDSVRLSIVCYLRKRLWANTKGVSKSAMNAQFSMLKNMRNNNQKTKKRGH
jgi:hypothetical protein